MIIRVEHLKCFTTISNEALRDSHLSWKARGLLAYMLTHSDGYQIRIDNLVKASEPDGPASLATGIRELKTSGYLSYKNRKDPDSGLMAGGEWTIHEKPDPRFSGERFFRGAVFPGSGKPRSLKKDQDIRNTNKKEKPSKRRADIFDPLILPEPFSKHSDLIKAWAAFVEYRRKVRRCPISEHAWKRITKEMIPHPPEVIIAAIGKSMDNDWRGLFLPSPPQTVQKNQPIVPPTPTGQRLLNLIEELGFPADTHSIYTASAMTKGINEEYSRLLDLKNPRRPDQGPTDLMTREWFVKDWVRYLLDTRKGFPVRSLRDLEVGGYRWREYIKFCEAWTGYNFTSGKRRD
jgi:hypothetical protein